MSHTSNYHRAGFASTLGRVFSFGSRSQGQSQSLSSRWSGSSFVRSSRERRSFGSGTRSSSGAASGAGLASSSAAGLSYSVQTGYTSPTSPRSASRSYGATTNRTRLLTRTYSAPNTRSHSPARRSSGEFSSQRPEKPLDFVYIETKLNDHAVAPNPGKVDMDEVFGNTIPLSPTLSPVLMSPPAETRRSTQAKVTATSLPPRPLSPSSQVSSDAVSLVSPRTLTPTSPRALSPVSPRALSPVSSRALSPVQSSTTQSSTVPVTVNHNVEVDIHSAIRRAEQMEMELDQYKTRCEKETSLRQDLEKQLSEAREEIGALSGMNRRLKGDNEALRRRCESDELHCTTGLMDMRSHYEKVVRNTKKDLEAYYMERVRRVSDEAKRHAGELARVSANCKELSAQIRSLETENERLRRMAGFKTPNGSTTKTSSVTTSPTRAVTFSNGLSNSNSSSRTSKVTLKYVDSSSSSSISDEGDIMTSARSKSKNKLTAISTESMKTSDV